LVDDGLPFISIIIPVHPDEEQVKVLDSIQNINYPKDKIEVHIMTGPGPAKQRNIGIKKAKGEFLGFVDSHCEVDSNWILQAIEHFKDERVAIVGGPALIKNNEPLFCKCVGVAVGSFFGTAGMRKRYKALGLHPQKTDEKSLILCNLFARKSILEAEGAFDERLFPNEENELMTRLADRGYLLIYDPKIFVYHGQKSNLKELSKQIFNYGRGRIEHIFIRLKSFKLIYVMPSIFLIYLILSPFLIRLECLSLFTRLILLLYFSLSAFFSSYNSIIKKQWEYAILLPILYLTIHLSYGTGFLYGFARKLKNTL